MLRLAIIVSCDERIKMSCYTLGVPLNSLQIKSYKFEELLLASLRQIDDLVIVTDTQVNPIRLK